MTEQLIDRLLELRRARPLELPPERTALLVIDMQEYQVREGWAVHRSLNAVVPGLLDYYTARVRDTVEPNLQRLIAACRRKGVKVVYTAYSSFNPDGSDLPGPIRSLNHAVKTAFGDALFPPLNHPGSAIIPSLKPEPADLIIVKNTSGVFASTRLEFILKNMGIDRLLVAGVVTNMCVENAARVGSDLGFETAIVEDACAAWSPETHLHSLRSFEMVFGRVLDTDGVLRLLG